MEKIYCGIAGQEVSRCLLEIDQVNLEISSNICSECEEYKGRRWFEELKQRLQKEEQRQKESEEALAKGIIRYGVEPLPEPKRSDGKMPKQVYVIDTYSGKRRRLRFDVDYWKKDRFQSSLCLICQRPNNEYGWKKIVPKMTILEIIKQPEMKWMKRSKRPKIRTLAEWRRNRCEHFCKGVSGKL